jgi:HAD superfamily phosphoserine phosphatase-like hydrolase
VTITHAAARYASVVLDVDSTIAGLEGIDWLAALRGEDVARDIKALTDRAMAGEISLESVYEQRLALIKPSRIEIATLGRVYIREVQRGARALCAVLSASGSEVTLLSGGLRDAILPLAEYLDIPATRVHAVRVRYDADGVYEALDGDQPLATQRGKPATLFALNLPRPLVMVGDGSTDAATRGLTNAFIAYTGVARRESVVAVADHEARDYAELHDLLLADTP